MKIALLEPFLAGSHKSWAEGLMKHSRHHIQICALKGRHWKWRMYGGAVKLNSVFNNLDFYPDMILGTDMLDMTTFLALSRKKTAQIPVGVYFHENQISYPWSPSDKDVALNRNNQYGFINYTSALTADKVFFNSEFHKTSFLNSLPGFLKQFPDHQETGNVALIEKKSDVLPLGVDLKRFDEFEEVEKKEKAVILWNHRWEYDKNADAFFNSLFRLKEEGVLFQVIVLGKSYKHTPPVFEKAKVLLKEEILHFGYAENFEEYARLLWRADIMPVTSRQDFFGAAAVEGMYCGCYPLLPNRLAFPGHIPRIYWPRYLYENDEDLYDKLKKAILNLEATREEKKYRAFAARYDWSILKEVYDTAFLNLKRK